MKQLNLRLRGFQQDSDKVCVWMGVCCYAIVVLCGFFLFVFFFWFFVFVFAFFAFAFFAFSFWFGAFCFCGFVFVLVLCFCFGCRGWCMCCVVLICAVHGGESLAWQVA